MLAGLIATFAIPFLLGSIPWGLVIGKLVYHTDIREAGSGNIGTTNAMRVMGKGAGVAVFVLDFGKGLLSGFIAVCVASVCLAGDMPQALSWVAPRDFLALSFIACVSGHIYSPWLGFHGGKGIAVAVGCLFFVFGILGACLELALFAILVAATRRVSIGSIAAAVLCPFLALYWYWGDPFGWVLVSLAAVLVFWAHRANIQRLRQGTEPRIGSHA